MSARSERLRRRPKVATEMDRIASAWSRKAPEGPHEFDFEDDLEFESVRGRTLTIPRFALPAVPSVSFSLFQATFLRASHGLEGNDLRG